MQFTSIAVDMDKPYNVYGGLQDNGTWKGPSTYKYSREWYQEGKYPYQRLMGGDGMQVAVDTRDNNTVYVGYQFGNYFRVNAQSGDRKYITPSHELGDEPFRWNWEAPITLSSHNQDIVYFGSNRFHRSMNKGDDFETLSGDLTQGGKKGDVSYGTLTSISESPLRFGLIYVGSDDGLVHVTKDLGASWQNVSAGLPENYWVSQVYASHHKEGRVYVSLNGYRWDHFEPLVYVSEDYGAHWQKISANLPTEPVNVVKEDPNHENILYVGTDHGVYISLDRGKTYHAFSEGLVNAPVHDLVIHTREKDLVLGTHGRGIYIGDVQYVQQLTDKIIDKDLHLFAMDEVTFSENWGSKPWEWGDVNVPELDVIYFAGKEGSATIDLLYKDQVVVSKKDTTDQGLNYFDMPLQTDGDFKKLLSKQQQKTYEAAKDGQYYLVPGEYTLRVRLNGSSQQVPFTIKEPKKPEPRKE